MKKSYIFLALAVAAIIALVAIFGKSSLEPQIEVNNQSISNGSVVVQSVTAIADSWLVIQTETNGVPGPVIGYVKIKKGPNDNVTVKIDAAKTTPNLFAMIHVDDGERDKFDFPGNDMPLVNQQDEMVSKLFVIN